MRRVGHDADDAAMSSATSKSESANRLARPNVSRISLPLALGGDPAVLALAAGFGAMACGDPDEHPTCRRARANEPTRPRWAMRAAAVAFVATLGVGTLAYGFGSSPGSPAHVAISDGTSNT
jgi:hypothetical protein